MAANSSCSPLTSVLSSFRSRLRSACSVSAWECTDTYSPAAIDMAPATSPATPATNILPWVACEAATPSSKLAVETLPSFAPKTAARSHPIRSVRWRSLSRADLIIGPPALRPPPELLSAARVARGLSSKYVFLYCWLLQERPASNLCSMQGCFDGDRA